MKRRSKLTALSAATVLTACSIGATSDTQPTVSAQTAVTRQAQCARGFHGIGRALHLRRVRRPASISYVYVAEDNPTQMVIYPAGVTNPSPIGYQCLANIHPPHGVIADHEGQVYVALDGSTAGDGQVDIFSEGGKTLVGTLGTSSGITYPVGLAVDSNDNLYVTNTDAYNQRVQVFHHNATQPFCTLSPEIGSPPFAVATDASDNVYVSIGYSAFTRFGEFPAGCPTGGAVILPFFALLPIGGLTVDARGELAFSDFAESVGYYLAFYAYSPSQGWHETKQLNYSAQVNFLTTDVDGNMYVPLASPSCATSSVVVIPNSVQAPYSITNGVQCAVGAAGGV